VAQPKKTATKIAVPVKKTVRRGKASLSDAKKTPPIHDAPFSHLSPTSTPGVFINKNGNLTDHNGVLLDINRARSAEAKLSQLILGEAADSPAKLLKMIALDASLPLLVRLDAAKHAAPYFDKKTPIAVENTNTDKKLDLEAIASMPAEARRTLLAQLKELGVDLGGARK